MFLGLTAVALGVHRHEYSRWDHDPTDGDRYGCVAHALNGTHGFIGCATDNHIRRFTDTLSTYCNQPAHAESSSSSASWTTTTSPIPASRPRL